MSGSGRDPRAAVLRELRKARRDLFQPWRAWPWLMLEAMVARCGPV